MTTLSAWENFYVIVGSSAGALIGLQFVVLALIAGRPQGPGPAEAGSAFATPTVIHFSAALLLSAIMSAPWPALNAAGVAWGVLGTVGVIYSIIVIRRMKTQTAYRPEFEDWLFHALLPFAAYATLAASAIVPSARVETALYCVAAAALLLLFIGIHNAWDAVTYHVFVKTESAGEPKK